MLRQHGLPFFWGGIGNATWAGTPLAPLLQEAGILDQGREVVFYGTDESEKVERDADELPFARSMSIADAMNPNNLLCYEMNGAPLDPGHGAPLRLLAPGWFGIANVKWLDRIEVIDTRFMGHFMARDYVTIRDEQRDGQTVTTETLGGQGAAQVGASAGQPGRRPQDRRRGLGRPDRRASRSRSTAARGCRPPSPSDRGRVRLEVLVAVLAERRARRAHRHLAGDGHGGNVQPAMTDPRIANKKTYWESNGQITRRVNIA